MVRIITQETYDEVVKENIEEFDMSPEEAIKDAISQFEAQGVNLANIIKDLCLGSGDANLIPTTVSKLKDFNALPHQPDFEALLSELNTLKKECEKDLARRVKAAKEGAYPSLIQLLDSSLNIYLQDINENNEAIMVKIISTLTALMDTQPDLLDGKGIELIKRILDTVESDTILISTLKWTSICCVRHEENRQNIFKQNIVGNLKRFLIEKPKLLSETLQLIRKFTLDDDIRVEFGKAHDHSKELGVELLEPLMNILKSNTKPPLVSELMLTVATLLVRHELCKMAGSVGRDVLLTVLVDNYDNVAVVQQGSKLVTALAGNDDVKRDLVQSGIVPIIVSLLNRHSGNPACTSLLLKCISALCLRESEHGRQFLEAGAPSIVVDCMSIHKENSSVQKNACWAIRNMVSRCREHNTKFHELGVQALLNDAYDRFSDDFGFDIKSALRDLECDVKLDEQWTGKGVQMDNE